MEDKIFDIVTDLIRDDISKDEAIDKLLVLYNARLSLFQNNRLDLINWAKSELKQETNTKLGKMNKTLNKHEPETDVHTVLPTVPFGGMPVIVNDFACISQEWKQYRFPKSKKKRIRKKWAKQSRYFRMQDVHRVIKMQGKLFVSTKIFEQLKSLLEYGG